MRTAISCPRRAELPMILGQAAFLPKHQDYKSGLPPPRRSIKVVQWGQGRRFSWRLCEFAPTTLDKKLWPVRHVPQYCAPFFPRCPKGERIDWVDPAAVPRRVAEFEKH